MFRTTQVLKICDLAFPKLMQANTLYSLTNPPVSTLSFLTPIFLTSPLTQLPYIFSSDPALGGSLIPSFVFVIFLFISCIFPSLP